MNANVLLTYINNSTKASILFQMLFKLINR